MVLNSFSHYRFIEYYLRAPWMSNIVLAYAYKINLIVNSFYKRRVSNLPYIKRWLFTTTNVAQRALAIAHTTAGLILAVEKFIVVYKIVGYCTNIYKCMFIRKVPCSEKRIPFLNAGRRDLDAPDPALWKILYWIYIYINNSAPKHGCS